MSDETILEEIVESWKSGRNALLYGPPGTGKTRILSELWRRINHGGTSEDVWETGVGVAVGNDPSLPILRAGQGGTSAGGTEPAADIGIPTPSRAIWTTFHQSYAYEDFVVGLRPEPTLFRPNEDGPEHAVTTLRPWLGILMDAVVALRDGECESVVIFIDEINRGNAARIFGEMLTFLDFDYRSGGSRPLPVPIRQVKFLPDGKSEFVYRLHGDTTRLDHGFEFPEHIYIVATMNSVDRAAVPIDSALARRFDRAEMRPDVTVPADLWEIDLAKIPQAVTDDWQGLSAHETAILLLDHLNNVISEDHGPEFELGHGLILGIGKDDADPWLSLATAWDDLIYPQLEDRYAGNPARLQEILRVAEPASGGYAWQTRVGLNGRPSPSALAPVKLVQLAKIDADLTKRSFQWLASQA